MNAEPAEERAEDVSTAVVRAQGSEPTRRNPLVQSVRSLTTNLWLSHSLLSNVLSQSSSFMFTLLSGCSVQTAKQVRTAADASHTEHSDEEGDSDELHAEKGSSRAHSAQLSDTYKSLSSHPCLLTNRLSLVIQYTLSLALNISLTAFEII